jgi:hypothetical protein
MRTVNTNELPVVQTSKPLVITTGLNAPCNKKTMLSNEYTRILFLASAIAGANKLNYFKKIDSEWENLSDDGTTLKGLPGPRMRYWVGADALQEAINANAEIDIDDPEQAGLINKPTGEDQLFNVYNDLTEYGLNQSTIILFDPAMDFAVGNYLPSMTQIVFNSRCTGNDMVLDVTAIFSNIDEIGIYINELSLARDLGIIMAMMTGMEFGELNTIIQSSTINIDVEIDDTPLSKYYEDLNTTIALGKCNDVEDLKDVLISDMSKFLQVATHFPLMINEKSLATPEVSIVELLDMLEDKYILAMETDFFKKLCYRILSEVGNLSDKYSEYSERYLKEIFNP